LLISFRPGNPFHLPGIWLIAPIGCHDASVLGPMAGARPELLRVRVEGMLWSRFRSMASFKKSNLTSFS
jgi:hypothetical protein